MVAESANFAEALQMVHDMNASMTPVGAVDRVENSILEEIELEEEEHASHRAAEERPKSGPEARRIGIIASGICVCKKVSIDDTHLEGIQRLASAD